MDDAFFTAHYEADAANKARQSLKDYLEWVGVFYEGKRFPPVQGWRKRQDEILARLPSIERPRLAPLLEETGRLLAAEWAKDNAMRKVSTGDLQTWGKRFGDVAGEPEALVKALADVQADVARRTGA